MFKLSVFFINSGKLFHREGPANEIAFLTHVCLAKGNFKFCKFISCIYSTTWSKFKRFVTDKFECNSFYTMINSSSTLYHSKVLFRYVMHIMQSYAKSYAFILHDLHFLFRFFSKIRVPTWTCLIKMSLNKRITEHSSKFSAQESIFPIKEL